MTKRARPRDVPHPRPDPDGTGLKRRRRKPETLHGSASRPDPDVPEMRRRQRRAAPGRHDRPAPVRVPGTNGSWPAHGVGGDVGPKPPAICALYEDVAQDELPEAVFGQYPRVLIPKVLPWLRCARHEILHVCSGSLPPGEGIRVDVRPEARPDVIADGRALPFADGSIAAVMIDPPYTPQYARDLYGVEYPRPSHLLAEAARVVRPCGRIAIVHYLVPMPPDGCRIVKVLGLSTGFGFPMRAVTIYERHQDPLPLGGA